MQQNYIPFRETGFFSSLICDYLEEKDSVRQFYSRFPNIKNFKFQIEDKEQDFNKVSRTVLTQVLNKQYVKHQASISTQENIEALKSSKTFTITTGHQLNLFTGPLYFIYKICSTINLTRELKEKYPEYNFVPIYWMATEDHDFEEINYFNYKGKKVSWNRDSVGAVGELSTDGLSEVLEIFINEIGHSTNASYLVDLFNKSYLEHSNLADATRFLVNELFKDYGLVIIDANNVELKRQFIPFIKEELLNNTSFKTVTKTNQSLSNEYGIQVNPREINLFYLKDNLRERIVFEDGIYKVLNTGVFWSKTEILKEVLDFPERFSPNVIMRPLYQEVVLPNLCYIGGGGELAYWFQLKSFFEQVKVPFPILLLRNSVLIKTEKQAEKLKKSHISNKDMFLDQKTLVNKKIKEISNINIDFSSQKTYLKQQFKDLYHIAEQTDKSFFGAVKAQETKQLNGLDKLEKRLLMAQKRKLSEQVLIIKAIQNELFPNQSLQERYANFSEFYMVYGEEIISNLMNNLEPLRQEFLMLTI